VPHTTCVSGNVKKHILLRIFNFLNPSFLSFCFFSFFYFLFFSFFLLNRKLWEFEAARTPHMSHRGIQLHQQQAPPHRSSATPATNKKNDKKKGRSTNTYERHFLKE